MVAQHPTSYSIRLPPPGTLRLQNSEFKVRKARIAIASDKAGACTCSMYYLDELLMPCQCDRPRHGHFAYVLASKHEAERRRMGDNVCTAAGSSPAPRNEEGLVAATL